MGNVSLPAKLGAQNFSLTSAKAALTVTSAPASVIWLEPKITISIVSNSHLLREALIFLLKHYPFIRRVTPHPSGIERIQSITPPTQHVILLDSGIGQEALLAHLQEWRSPDSAPYIVVIELKNDPDLILDCIEAGAHAYALQGASSTQITKVIEQVYQGAFQCPPEITAKLFDRLSQPKTVQQLREKSPLTRRELEVLTYIAKEYSNREIAAQLFVEVRTVKHHVHNILHKLNVRHRWDAAQLALKNCWLNLPSA
jgi:DNA-binding NarL/FixJ family response regulator